MSCTVPIVDKKKTISKFVRAGRVCVCFFLIIIMRIDTESAPAVLARSRATYPQTSLLRPLHHTGRGRSYQGRRGEKSEPPLSSYGGTANTRVTGAGSSSPSGATRFAANRSVVRGTRGLGGGDHMLEGAVQFVDATRKVDASRSRSMMSKEKSGRETQLWPRKRKSSTGYRRADPPGSFSSGVSHDNNGII